jgi:hypothetical protein
VQALEGKAPASCAHWVQPSEQLGVQGVVAVSKCGPKVQQPVPYSSKGSEHVSIKVLCMLSGSDLRAEWMGQ